MTKRIEKTIYLVIESEGEYDSYQERPVIAFASEALANEYIEDIHSNERLGHQALSDLTVESIKLIKEIKEKKSWTEEPWRKGNHCYK
jgi:hypothetical protein